MIYSSQMEDRVKRHHEELEAQRIATGGSGMYHSLFKMYLYHYSDCIVVMCSIC